MLVSWQFSGPYGVTIYGSGWRKVVVNQCLECAIRVNYKVLQLLQSGCGFVGEGDGGGGGGGERAHTVRTETGLNQSGCPQT